MSSITSLGQNPEDFRKNRKKAGKKIILPAFLPVMLP